MSTQVFFRTSGTATPDLGTGTNPARLDGTTQGWQIFPMSLSRGSGNTQVSTTSVTGPTNGLEGNSQIASWISPPIDADVTIAGTITVNLWMQEAMASANATAQVVIERIDSMGVIQETVLNSQRGTELTTSVAVQNWTPTPTSTVFKKGDRIRVRIAFNDATALTMGSGQALNFNYNGSTAGISGDSYVTFTETFGFLTTAPSGTIIYPTDTASPVATASVDREAWTSRGAGVQSDVRNTAAGWTAPLQLTDTAGGTVVDWWTKALAAFTLAGRVDVNNRGLFSAASTNAIPRWEIAVCNGDGTGCTNWAGATAWEGHGTTESAKPVIIAGDDLAVSEGQRLRLRMLVDDGKNEGTTAESAMVTGRTFTEFYAGTSGGASGDTFLTFSQTLTEAVSLTAAQMAGIFQPESPDLQIAE